jgi:preprotein translocase subunit YajC
MLNNIFVSDAFAQGAEAAAQEGFSFSSFVPLILIFGIFYFLIIRPQSKKHQMHQQMVSGLKVGNKIVTSGGISGVVKDVLEKENQFEIEIAENVRVKILRQHVSELVTTEVKSKK